MKKVLIMVRKDGCSGISYIGQTHILTGSEALAKDVDVAARAIREKGFAPAFSNLFASRYEKRSADFVKFLQEEVEELKIGEIEGKLSEIAAVVLLGSVAKQQTLNAFACGTNNHLAWRDYLINGESKGEIGMYKTYFWNKGVPIVVVSGDFAACEEAKQEIAGVETAVTKQAKWRNVAECLPVEKARENIYNAILSALDKLDTFTTKEIPMPIKVEIEFSRTDFCDDCIRHNNYLVDRISDRRTSKTIEKLTSVGQLIY